MYFPKSKWIGDRFVRSIIDNTDNSYYLLYRLKKDYYSYIEAFTLNANSYSVIFTFKRKEYDPLDTAIKEVLNLVSIDYKFGDYIKKKFKSYIYDTINYSIPELKLSNDKEFILNNKKAFIFINIGKEMISYIIIDKKKANKYKIEEIEEFKIVNKF